MQFDRAPTPSSTPVPLSSSATPSPSRSQCSSPDPLDGRVRPELGREGNSSQHPSIYYSFPSTINADPESGMNGMTTSYAGTTSQFQSRAATVVHVAGPEDATTSRCVSSTVHDAARMDLEMKEERDGVNEGSKEVSSRTPKVADHSPFSPYFNWTRKLRRFNRRYSNSNSNARPSQGGHITDKFLSSITLTLENNGSVARDHLASERTFLAYVRTSLGCSTMGVGERSLVVDINCWLVVLTSRLISRHGRHEL